VLDQGREHVAGDVPLRVENGWFSCRESGMIRCTNKTEQENTPMKTKPGIFHDSKNNSKAQCEQVRIECLLPMAELIAGVRHDIEAFSAQIGLQIMRHVMDAEVAERIGEHGSQDHHRHGQQGGYAVFGGRKVTIQRPRMRKKGGPEGRLKSYAAFQQNGKMQRAVARQLVRQCSTRDYSGAIDDCLDGYGIEKSSVSRHWKAATEKELQKLCQRPVPKNLVALMIDGKAFAKETLIVALGIDAEGVKHVLGLWHGATENSTVVKDLLVDLRERGLETERSILVVLDGAKALLAAVKAVFGGRAIVQRCRVHKQRNILDYLPKEKQEQARWRLRAAWQKTSYTEAKKELRAVAK